MPEISTDRDNWSIACSDDENGEVKTKTNYEPPTAELIRLYGALDAEGPLDIEWQWRHGRRAPTDPRDELDEGDDEAMESKPEEKSDFDFMDEATTPILRKGKASGPKGSAKKKTTSFSGVLSNMRRHRQQDRLEKEDTTLQRNKR